MNLYAKTALLACGVAVASSAITMLAVNTIDSNNTGHSISALFNEDGSAHNGGAFYTVSNSVTPPTDFTHAAESTINGVVSIKSYTNRTQQYSQGDGQYIDPFEFFFGNPFGGNNQQRKRQQQPQSNEKDEVQKGLGSGVIISADGYIVTNNHVIDGADRLEVTLNDNRIYNAKVIGSDASTDVALLKIEEKGLHVIPFGDSDKLRVGEWVLAVGNPFGFTSTVTTGIVSAKARGMQSSDHNGKMGIESYIQTDAAVNPGNSGGALVNINGELVGINTAIYSQTGNYAGCSFAIPSSIVTKIVTDLRQYGTVQRAILGIAFTELTPQMAKEKNITATNDGILVGEVMDQSAAMEAGIKANDIIIAINGTATHNTAQLQGEISKYRPGDKITVKYVRENKTATTTVTLRNNQGNTKVTQAGNMSSLGCAFVQLSDKEKSEYQLSSGLKVTGLKDGKFKQAGIKNGFVIIDINNMRVRTQDDVEQIYNSIMNSSDTDKVMFITGIYPTGRRVYYAVDLSAE
jgi:Do/DeqQ family serine protease